MTPRSPEPPENVPRTLVRSSSAAAFPRGRRTPTRFQQGSCAGFPARGSADLTVRGLLSRSTGRIGLNTNTECSQPIPKNPKLRQKLQTKHLSTSFLLAPTIAELAAGPPNIKSTYSLKKFCANEKPPVTDVSVHGSSGAAPFDPGQTPRVPEPRDPKPDSKILF